MYHLFLDNVLREHDKKFKETKNKKANDNLIEFLAIKNMIWYYHNNIIITSNKQSIFQY